MSRSRKIKHQLRRRFDDENIARVEICVPQSVLKDADKITATFNPDLFYNRSHYITCALIKMNKEFINKIKEIKA